MPKKTDLRHITAEELRPLAVPLSSLTADPDNERHHDRTSIDRKKFSLLELGMRSSLSVRQDGKATLVTTGNGILEALRELAEERAVGRWKDAPKGPLAWDHVPVCEFADDKATAAKHRLLDNAAGRDSADDPDAVEATISLWPEVNWAAGGWGADDLEAARDAWADVPTFGDGDPGSYPLGDSGDAGGGDPGGGPGPMGDPAEDVIPDTPSEPVTQFGEVIQLGPHTLHCQDCMVVMAGLPDNSLHAIVVDPPYGLSPDGKARTWDDIAAMRAEGKGKNLKGFMSSSWDAGVPGVTWASECLRVLRPGGYLAAYSATRTIHRLTCGIEDAGFDIIDQLNWLQWEGMPHGANASLMIDKAAGVEREVVGGRGYTSPDFSEEQFTSQGSMMQTHEKAGRVEVPVTAPATDLAKAWHDYHTRLKPCAEPICLAQKPIEGTVVENIKKWGCGALNIGATRHPEGDPSWPGPNTKIGAQYFPPNDSRSTAIEGFADGSMRKGFMYDPVGGRFTGNVFQYPKPSRSERNAGTDGMPEQAKAQSAGAMHANDDLSRRFLSAPMANIHPTVKPVAAMRRLLRLVLPPGHAVVGEWFGGSGTTPVAAAGLDCSVIICEMEPRYADIIRARVEHSLANAKAPA